MRFTNLITGVDSHTGGEPTRVVTSGLPLIKGTSMRDKTRYIREHFDHLRKALNREPRGHNAIVTAYLTEPVNQSSRFGVIFSNNSTYLGMCGHGLIGVATVVAELGMLKVGNGPNSIFFDTPSGQVEANVFLNANGVKHVTIRNVPSFVYREQVQVRTKSGRLVNGNIAYGGNWFFLLSAEEIQVEIKKKNIEQLMSVTSEIYKALSELKVISPFTKQEISPNHIKVHSEVQGDNSEATFKSFVLCPGLAYDRSPCGTGMSAEMALLYHRGKIRLNEKCRSESVIGSTFWGELVGEVQVGEYSAVVPEITGTAYVTSLFQMVVNPNDPFKYGI